MISQVGLKIFAYKRNGMPREYVKELSGDRIGVTIDIYYHVDRQELRRVYLAYVLAWSIIWLSFLRGRGS